VLPRAPRAQASWNYVLPSCDANPTNVHLSYHMNRLQRLDVDQTYVVTLNGGAAQVVRPDPEGGALAAFACLPVVAIVNRGITRSPSPWASPASAILAALFLPRTERVCSSHATSIM